MRSCVLKNRKIERDAFLCVLQPEAEQTAKSASLFILFGHSGMTRSFGAVVYSVIGISVFSAFGSI